MFFFLLFHIKNFWREVHHTKLFLLKDMKFKHLLIKII